MNAQPRMRTRGFRTEDDAMTTTSSFRDGNSRRGMLLLVVLSMLTLFVLMGALAIVIATRSRASARAFADAGGSMQASVVAKAMTEEALLTLIRGSKDPAVNTLLGNDSLLRDMYGTESKGAFVEESYDAFDDKNKFLTQVTLDADGRVSGVPRPAFGGTNSQCTVDNDGDGVLDGIWLPQSSGSAGVLRPLTLPDGNTLTFRVSYLVLDLDGRINVNAHGKRVDAPSAETGKSGPADINASNLTSAPVTPAIWTLLMERTSGQLLTGSISPSNQWRPAPPISSPVDGRFGALKDGNGAAESDTYKLRLDLEARRPATLANATDQNPFTLGELERVLRQFDADASTLPPRLAGILHDRAERTRMRITTDSWDTPGERVDINWVTSNSGIPDEIADWQKICDVIQKFVPEVPVSDLKQWVANVIQFRDIDVANPPFQGVTGVEPTELDFTIPGGPVGWDKGYFLSYAQLLGVPQGTKQQIKQNHDKTPPEVFSLAKTYPKILEALRVPSPFAATIAVDPKREPGRINVNTCDKAVWDALIGEVRDNPFADPVNAAESVGDLLMHKDLVFNGDPTFSVMSVNHSVANRLANSATVRSHVFAVWITLEVKRSDNTDQPTYHRLFAIVDRSVPATFTAQTEGQNTNVRDTIRLQRFLN
jgi:hypothetical protein